MKSNYTHIAVLLDSSGSMASIKSDIIGGYNTFIKEQKAVEGEATISLSSFSSDYKVIHEFVNLKDVEDLNDVTYRVGGLTALNDSLAKLINDTGVSLSNLDESERPEVVLLLIITDGDENGSKEFTTAQVKEMIEHQEKQYSWKVVYIGANQDAFKEGASRGVTSNINFEANSKGIKNTMSFLSKSTANYRGDVGSLYSRARQKSALTGQLESVNLSSVTFDTNIKED